MSTDVEVAGLIEGYLEGVFEQFEELVTEEDSFEFVTAVVRRVVEEHGVKPLSADYVAEQARAYARDYQRDLDGGA